MEALPPGHSPPRARLTPQTPLAGRILPQHLREPVCDSRDQRARVARPPHHPMSIRGGFAVHHWPLPSSAPSLRKPQRPGEPAIGDGIGDVPDDRRLATALPETTGPTRCSEWGEVQCLREPLRRGAVDEEIRRIWGAGFKRPYLGSRNGQGLTRTAARSLDIPGFSLGDASSILRYLCSAMRGLGDLADGTTLEGLSTTELIRDRRRVAPSPCRARRRRVDSIPWLTCTIPRFILVGREKTALSSVDILLRADNPDSDSSETPCCTRCHVAIYYPSVPSRTPPQPSNSTPPMILWWPSH